MVGRQTCTRSDTITKQARKQKRTSKQEQTSKQNRTKNKLKIQTHKFRSVVKTEDSI